MRFLMTALVTAAVSLCAPISGAFAEVPDATSVQPATGPAPGSAPGSTPGPASVTTPVTQDSIVRQHPHWFSEAGIPYRPCPCSVVFPDGRHACIGTP
jgi:hypothetical protein